MTAEEYRQRMIQAFHNADCDELISVCVLPTEKEFNHLEWLLKNHYKKEPCGDAISRSDAIRIASGYCHWSNIPKELAKLPSVNPIQCEDVISRQAIIDSLHSKFVDGFDSDRWWNSMSVLYAINKVPSVSTKKPNRCGDTISRQAVLKGLASIAKAKAKSDAQKSMMGRTMFFVEQLPSVSTEKTGHWEWVPYDSNPNIGNWHCSECNRIVCGAITAVNPVYSYKYCPNCGAKMGVE